MGTFPNASSLDSPAAKCHLDFISSIWPCVEADGHQNHFSCDTLVETKICEVVLSIRCLELVQQFEVSFLKVDSFDVGR